MIGRPGRDDDPQPGTPASWPALRLALDASPALVTVFAGRQHLLLYQNPASARHGNRPLGVEAIEAFPEFPDWLTALDTVYDHAETLRLEQVPRMLGGRQTALDVSCTPLHADDGSVWAALCQAVEIPVRRVDDDHLRHAVLLARSAAELSRSLDIDQVTWAITRLGGEVFEGWCVLDLWEPDGSLRRVAGTHQDRTLQPALDELVRLPRVSGLARGEESAAARVARTGRAALGRFDPTTLVRSAPSVEHGRILDRLRPGPYLIVPVEVGARRLGALALVRGEEAEDFTPGDRFVAEQFAERAAVALSHARDYDEQRQAVLVLQRAMLSPVPPTVPGVEVAVRYRAAGKGASIGGDWYDVFRLDDATLGIVVGDVAGHDLAAAAVMSQVRSVVHSHALTGLPPGLVAEHANRFICEQQDDYLVTMTYLQLHPAEQLMVWTRAGHMPIVFVHENDHRVLAAGGGLPLGVDTRARWPEHTTHLPAGCVTAVFTDGLVESPGEALDDGIARLVSSLGGAESKNLDALSEQIVSGQAANEPAPGDDVALVLFRLAEMAASRRQRIVRRLPPAASSTGVARHFVTELLGQWGLDEEVMTAAALLVSELVTNATRHTDSTIELRVELGEQLRVEVYDDSHRLPEAKHAGPDETAGRGLELVALLSTRWGVQPERFGKAVWFELATSSNGGSRSAPSATSPE